MDRNSAIGLTLIAILLLLYFNFFVPEPPKETGTPITQTINPSDSLAGRSPAAIDTLEKVSTPFASQPIVEEQLTRVENNDLILTFTNKGGILKEVELKKFKTYYKKPLLLASTLFNAFKLNAIVEGKDVDLYSLFYSPEE